MGFHLSLIHIYETTRTAAAGDILLVNSGGLHGGTPYDCVYECLVFPVGLLFSQTFDSVSYTHLDVYKRQLPLFITAQMHFDLRGRFQPGWRIQDLTVLIDVYQFFRRDKMCIRDRPNTVRILRRHLILLYS